MFCKHQWEVQVDKVVPSLLERLAKMEDCWDRTVKGHNTPGQSITILACKLCGKIDKTIVEV